MYKFVHFNFINLLIGVIGCEMCLNLQFAWKILFKLKKILNFNSLSSKSTKNHLTKLWSIMLFL